MSLVGVPQGQFQPEVGVRLVGWGRTVSGVEFPGLGDCGVPVHHAVAVVVAGVPRLENEVRAEHWAEEPDQFFVGWDSAVLAEAPHVGKGVREIFGRWGGLPW